MHLLDPSDFYKGFDIGPENNILTPLLDDNVQGSLMELWAEKFKNFNKVNVCLSGGIDSQFVLSTLSKLNKDITVYIFSFVWEDCVFNSPDVTHAIRYCNRYNHKFKNIEIDYKEFVEGTSFIEYCRQYHATSPQIALQLKMLDYIDNEDPIFLGGDTPIIDYNFSDKTASIKGIGYQLNMTYTFLNYARLNKKIVIKELFRMCPKTHALSYLEFLNTTKKHKIVVPSIGVNAGQTQPLRAAFYQDLGADLIPPLLKNTGFEILKMHLAKKTGIYNEYDIRYRTTIKQVLAREDWYQEQIKYQTLKLVIVPFLEKIRSEFENFCKTAPDIKPIGLYNFIL